MWWLFSMVLGAMYGGITGAIIGALLGFIVWDLRKENNKDDNKVTGIDRIDLFIILLAKIAIVDGLISAKKMTIVSDLFSSMNLNQKDQETASKIFINVINDNTNIYKYAKQYSNITNNKMCEEVYAILWAVAKADGKIHKSKDLILKNLTNSLRIQKSCYYKYKHKSEISKSSSSNIDKYYNFLGCSRKDTDKTIKQKYQKAIVNYRIDKIQSENLSENFIKLAKEQTRKTELAYKTIKEHRKSI